MELYSEFRSEIKSGDLLAWEIKKINSFIDFLLLLYQKIYRIKYSHVGIAVVYGNRVFCLEASSPQVRLVPLSLLGDFYIVKANVKWKKQYDNILLSEIAKPYSLFDYVRNILGFKRSSDSLYCSELVANFYLDIAYTFNEDAGLNPSDLVKEIVKESNNEPIFVKIDRGNNHDI
ncbi:MAG: hypothetical protein ACD_33C00041G0008 [uncultured bacterium]|nr:MAG: hypothetical protein ACD_33C00041G0008 [uncultured bacterium]